MLEGILLGISFTLTGILAAIWRVGDRLNDIRDNMK